MTGWIPAWENGELKPLDKMDVHRRGLRHKAISVFVLRGNEVLLQRRARHKYHTPGLWTNTCCTHPHWGEGDATCATRRLREELGITGLSLVHAGEIEYRAEVGNDLIEHELVQVFTAAATPSMVIQPNPAEVSETDWVPLPALVSMVDRFPARFTPWLAIYLRDHIDTIFAAHEALMQPGYRVYG
jgi:isopentenyl-diphosphate Delta-isomerase